MAESKNVAIFIDSLGGGGAERVMINLAKGLADSGHQPYIFCLESRKDHELPENIPVRILYSGKKLRKIINVFNLASTVKDLQNLVSSVAKNIGEFDLHLSNLDPTNKVLSRCDFHKVFYILHNSMEEEIARDKKLGPLKYWKKLRAKRVMNHKNLVAVSEGVSKEAITLGVITPKSVTTIYNPCDAKKITELSNIPNPEIPVFPYLIHVGRVVKQKRHDVLFRALKNVPEIKLVLLCKDIDKAKKLAKKHGIEDRIVTPGFTTNPYNWIKNAKLMVLSSDFEGLPTVLVESLICNTPVVSTDCKYGPAEILTCDMANYLSPVGDAVALGANIVKALDTPPSIEGADILDEVTMKKAVERYIALIAKR